MKRFAVIILTLVYLIAATGTTVNLHYCMGELADFSLWGPKNKTCGKCGMEKAASQDNGCCKDEQKQVKLEDDHKLSQTFFTWNVPAPATHIVVYYPVSDLAATLATEEFPVSHAPPLTGKAPTYLRYCVFRI